MPTFDATDFDNAVSESGTVHESVTNTDHTDASQLKQGYDIANPYLSADLAGYWPLQEDSGSTAYDFSGNNNDGSYNGPTLGQTGLLGTTAPSWDGTDDYMLTTSDLGLTKPYTYFFWVNSTMSAKGGVGEWGTRTDSDGRLFIQLNENYQPNNVDGQLRVFGTTGSTSSDASPSNNPNLTDGNWHFVCVVRDTSIANNLRINIDGVDVSIDGNLPDGDINNSSTGWRLGTLDNNTNPFSGRFAHTGFYDIALTESQIQTLYDVVATKGDLTTQFKSV